MRLLSLVQRQMGVVVVVGHGMLLLREEQVDRVVVDKLMPPLRLLVEMQFLDLFFRHQYC